MQLAVEDMAGCHPPRDRRSKRRYRRTNPRECFGGPALRLGSTQIPDLERQAALGGQRDGGVDAGWLRADVLGTEAAQKDRQRQHVLDLTHGAADARALSPAERQI